MPSIADLALPCAPDVDCYRGMHVVPPRHRLSGLELLTTGQCAERHRHASMQQSHGSPRNLILPTVPMGQCTHALAISRRAASHLVSQAFPVSDVFDNLFYAHFARQAKRVGLNFRAFNLSLFAQVAKVTQMTYVQRAMRSQNHGAPTKLRFGRSLQA